MKRLARPTRRSWALVGEASVAEGIRAYTLDAAYQVEADAYSGSLEPGKRADFIVLDRNLFEIPEDDIVDTAVLKTVVNGNVVYEAE